MMLKASHKDYRNTSPNRTGALNLMTLARQSVLLATTINQKQ